MEKNYRNVSKTREVIKIDGDTGEIVGTTIESQRVIWDKEPDYVKLYFSDISRLKSLPPASEKLLLLIAKHMGYNNTFTAYKPVKVMLCEALGMTMNTLNMQISNLKKAGILISLPQYGRGIYLVDPNLFARGKWEDIKNLRLTIDYNADGTKSIKSNMKESINQLQEVFDER